MDDINHRVHTAEHRIGKLEEKLVKNIHNEAEREQRKTC
jgi:hypothetical protein